VIASSPEMAALCARVGRCRIGVVRDREPYEALVRAIAHQQLHGRAAEMILGRFTALYPGVAFPSPDMVLATEAAALRGCGFSGGKVAAATSRCMPSAAWCRPGGRRRGSTTRR